MQKLSDFLEKFKSLGQKEKEEKEKVKKVVNDLLKIEINNKDFEIKDLCIRFKISGGRKTEIILNKNNILNVLNQMSEQKYIDLN